ncbi:MAG: histidinol dehydrogenase, partial [Myxococcota bacterium]
MRHFDSTSPDFDQALGALLANRHDPAVDPSVEARVRGILAEVRQEGDEALVRWTNELDRADFTSVASLTVDQAAMDAARERVGAQVVADLQVAAERIRMFHRRQREESWSITTEDGVRLGHRVVPLAAVGVYVPGGTAAYPSSVLMNVIPARVAGVERIVMVSPAPGGVIPDGVLAAASVAGVDELYAVGGAQAVGALAFGTQSIAAVDKIVGPGNIWVATAKRQVFGTVDIDMIAGPSELCVVATSNGGATPAQLAADLLSQAEHDPLAMVSLVSPDRGLIESVTGEVARQAAAMPRSAIAQAAIRDYAISVLTPDIETALAVADRIAPEHLELVIVDADAAAERIRNAGAIFVGPHTPEAIGDYIAGPNHVLPTNGTARFSSALGVYDFIKRINVIRFSRAALETLGPA